MKNILAFIFAIAIGSILGFYGVFASVFTDGSTSERMVGISIVLLIYCILSALLGFLLPHISWKWGLILSSPGAAFLMLYFAKERNPYYLLYFVLIIGLSYISSKYSSKIKIHGKNK